MTRPGIEPSSSRASGEHTKPLSGQIFGNLICPTIYPLLEDKRWVHAFRKGISENLEFELGSAISSDELLFENYVCEKSPMTFFFLKAPGIKCCKCFYFNKKNA